MVKSGLGKAKLLTVEAHKQQREAADRYLAMMKSHEWKLKQRKRKADAAWRKRKAELVAWEDSKAEQVQVPPLCDPPPYDDGVPRDDQPRCLGFFNDPPTCLGYLTHPRLPYGYYIANGLAYPEEYKYCGRKCGYRI